MLRDKNYYTHIYDKMVEEYLYNYSKENGNLDNADSMTYIETVDEIVGYYISTYDNEALEKWTNNLKYAERRHTDEEITKILAELCKKGGNI